MQIASKVHNKATKTTQWPLISIIPTFHQHNSHLRVQHTITTRPTLHMGCWNVGVELLSDYCVVYSILLCTFFTICFLPTSAWTKVRSSTCQQIARNNQAVPVKPVSVQSDQPVLNNSGPLSLFQTRARGTKLKRRNIFGREKQHTNTL